MNAFIYVTLLILVFVTDDDTKVRTSTAGKIRKQVIFNSSIIVYCVFSEISKRKYCQDLLTVLNVQ